MPTPLFLYAADLTGRPLLFLCLLRFFLFPSLLSVFRGEARGYVPFLHFRHVCGASVAAPMEQGDVSDVYL